MTARAREAGCRSRGVGTRFVCAGTAGAVAAGLLTSFGVMAIGLALAAIVSAAGSAAGEAERPGDQPASPLVVYTVSYPLQYFAERIGGPAVRAVFPAPPKVDPAFWAPTSASILAYQRADLIVLNGARYARWTERATLPLARLVDTSAGFRERYLVREDTVEHTHGPTGAHTHGDLAFTTWLDPALAREQARAIRDALTTPRPQHDAAFDAGLASLEHDLDALDREFRRITQSAPSRLLLASHPVYQYLARAYGLRLESVHFEPDEEPSEEAWKELRALVERHAAQWMLWEDTPLEATRARLAELGIESLVFDPCARVPAEGDYLTVMQRNAASLARAYE